MQLKNRYPKKRFGPPSLLLAGAPNSNFYEYFEGTDSYIFNNSEIPPWVCPELIFFYYDPKLTEWVIRTSLEHQCPVINIMFAPPILNWSTARLDNLTKFGHLTLAIDETLAHHYKVDVFPADRDGFLEKLRYFEYYPLKPN